MGHRVPNHRNKCRHPHGHRYRLEVTLAGEVKSQAGAHDEGMIFDFCDLKQILKTAIHDPLDHIFMYCEDDSIMHSFAKTDAKNLNLFAVPFVPTAENIVIWCHTQLVSHIPSHIKISRLRLYETPNSWADFSPKNI